MEVDSPDGILSEADPSLILIDFGVSIDMTLLPKGAVFNMAFERKDTRSPEMMEGKDWSYQVNIFLSVSQQLL